MKEMLSHEIEQVSGGCTEYCWGDFEAGGFAASMVGGAVAGAAGGPVGIFAGAAGGGIAYLFTTAWVNN